MIFVQLASKGRLPYIDNYTQEQIHLEFMKELKTGAFINPYVTVEKIIYPDTKMMMKIDSMVSKRIEMKGEKIVKKIIETNKILL